MPINSCADLRLSFVTVSSCSITEISVVSIMTFSVVRETMLCSSVANGCSVSSRSRLLSFAGTLAAARAASAGVVFYLIARTSYMANRIVGSILLALILIGTALTVFLCAKNRGKLSLDGRTLRLFPDGFNPLLFYFICVLWAVVLAACLLFGSGFAFYAMFAAIAVELIGAVYYTFQLK